MSNTRAIKMLESIGRMLSTDIRVRVLWSLLEEEGEGAYISDLADKLNLSIGAISHHLTILLMAGVVEIESVGRSKEVRVSGRFKLVLGKLFDLVQEQEGEEEEEQ